MITDKNYYRILEIPTDASQEQIKTAYRRLVKRWHPDLNNNSLESQEKLKEINEAYEILSDETARMIYNETIHANESVRSSSSAAESVQQRMQREEERKRQEKVRNVYESRSQNADEYYTEFEKVLNQYKNDRCDSSLADKINIIYNDTREMNPIMRIYSLPGLLLFAVCWHLCELFGRMFCIIFNLFLHE